MIYKKINLLDNPTEYDFMPYMETYILDGEKRPMIVICPGGAYSFTSEREAERIAVNYNAAGFHAAVIWYCVSPHKFPMALKNVAKAITIIRENEQEWNIDSNKVMVCGFSAGGHLASSISTMWNDKEIFSEEDIASKIHRPNATILCYPVITSGEYAHKWSISSLLKDEDETNPLWKKVSIENCVDGETPPAFVWHTYEDEAVPVENSLLYVGALRKNGIPFELHIFDKGPHGLSLVSDDVIWSKGRFEREYPWLKLSVDWVNNLQL